MAAANLNADKNESYLPDFTKHHQPFRSFSGGVRGNAVDLSIGRSPDLGVNPFVFAPFGDPWLRGSERFRTIVYDSAHFLENLLENADSSFGIIGSEHRCVGGKSHNGILELWFSLFADERL